MPIMVMPVMIVCRLRRSKEKNARLWPLVPFRQGRSGAKKLYPTTRTRFVDFAI
jgi:hypothetical protein